MFITIVIPTFNSEKNIAKCMDSIVRAYNNFDTFKLEILLVDGNSNDETVVQFLKYIDGFKDIRVGHQVICENDNGIYDAWNKGIKAANGDFLCFLASDDYLDPDVFKNISPFLKDFDIISGGIRKIYSNGNTRNFYSEKQNYLSLASRMKFKFPATFFNKNIFHTLGDFDINYKYSGDYDYLFRIYKVPFRIKYLNKILCNMNMGGVTNSLNNLDQISNEDYILKISNGIPKIISYFFYLKRKLEISIIRTLKSH